MSVGLARVTISAPQRRVDVTLPEHVPLADLLPEVLRHAGDGLADDGEEHGGWLLRRADGVALVPGQGLFVQGVRDGEVLHLVPARAVWPELEYDDVVEAIADGARRRGAAWSPAATRTGALVACGVPLLVGLFAVLRHAPTAGDGGYVALGVAVLLAVAAIAASRAYGDANAGGVLGGYALGYAFVAGAALVSSGDPVGLLPFARWIGAPELLAGSVAMLLFAVLGAAGVAAGTRVFAAGATVGLLGAASAAAALFVPTAGAAAVLLAALVCGVGAIPLLAIRFGKMPMPPVTLPSGSEQAESFTAVAGDALDAARERPDRAQVFAAVARTEELLTGMLTGHAALSVAASLVLVVTGGMWGAVLAAIAATSALLRSRLFVTVRQRIPLLTAGLGGFLILGIALVARATGPQVVALLATVLVAALLTVVAGATYSRRPPSPYLGRAADLLDTVLVIAVVPVACAVLDLYTRMRGLTG